MSFDINFNVGVTVSAPGLEALFTNLILPKLEQILMNQTEAIAKLTELEGKIDAQGATIAKISGETTGLLVEIQTLKDLQGQEPQLSPAFAAKLQSVFDKADAAQLALASVDNLVPDPAA